MSKIIRTAAKAKETEAPKYEVLEDIADLGKRGKATLKLRYIKWGDNEPKYDIRAWKEDEDGNEISLKGTTLSGEELIALRDALNGMEEE
jgi:hypothetical protein